MRYFNAISLIIERYYVELFFIEILLLSIFFFRADIIALMIIGFFASVTISTFLKAAVREKRPKQAIERREFRRIFRIELRSFPSSHSTAAAFFAGFCLNTVAFIPTALFALVVMYSRVYIKSHYPRDVIMGGIIGAAIGLISSNLHVFSYLI